ncbi:MAG: two-component sensor histidine kinase [Pseudonocardiaceae bacterium]|nr:two-component sensor histidine kinase [Pseudonocardiaceae bacterium]
MFGVGESARPTTDEPKPGDLDNGATTDASQPISAKYSRFLSPMAPRLAYGLAAAVFCGFGLVASISVLETGGGIEEMALSAVYVIALLALQLRYFSRPGTIFRAPFCYLALAAQACLVYLPMLQFTWAWTGLPGLLAGNVLLVLRASVSIPLFILIMASVAGMHVVLDSGLATTAHGVVSAVISGLIVYGLIRLARLVTELHEARHELAEMAVAEERFRFARDLHDLLGMSLSGITLKSELTDKLLTEHPSRARVELAEILELSRKALADVRSVASGYQELSFDDELVSARSVLGAADIAVDIRIERELDCPTGTTVLGTVLREAITNVLRHSDAKWCQITVQGAGGTQGLVVVNDGLRPGMSGVIRQHGSGTGLDSISRRVEMNGGELTAEITGDGHFRLRATVPRKSGD